MKFIRTFFIFAIGLFTAVILYPFLHESGHSLFAVALGGKVTEFNLLPLPNIVCNVSGLEARAIAFIGLGGLLFPLIFTALVNIKNFWAWLIGIYISFITFLSYLISLYGCIAYAYGTAVVNEDVTQIIDIYPNAFSGLIILLIALMGIVAFQVVKSKGLQRYL